MRDAFVAELTQLAAVDPSVMLITGDLGFGVLDNYAAQFPEQFLNAGVAEQNRQAACGLALEGHKVLHIPLLTLQRYGRWNRLEMISVTTTRM